MGKLFVRERRRVGEGDGQPRYRVVAVTGSDLRPFVKHLRRAELEQIAMEAEVELVYLTRGELAGEAAGRHGGGGRRHRQRGETAE